MKMILNMTIKPKVYILFLIIYIFINGCDIGAQDTEGSAPINIVVLLDLSDRVSSPEYGDISRRDVINDIRHCRSILKEFREILRRSRHKDLEKLRFVVIDQPGLPLGRNNTIVFNKEFKKNLQTVVTKEEMIFDELYELYLKAHTYDNQILTGAAIWSWFNEKSNDFLLHGHRNYIICMTDGYPEFNKEVKEYMPTGTHVTVDKEIRISDDLNAMLEMDKYKLKKPENVDFSIGYKYEVQFLMLGIKNRMEKINRKELGYTPKIDDRDILEGIWERWLRSMGIKHFDFRSSDVDSEEITNFLSTEVPTVIQTTK